MQWTSYYLITFLVYFLFIDIFSIVYTPLPYKREKDEKYSFLNHFSFEANDLKKTKELVILRISTIISCFFPFLLAIPLFSNNLFNGNFGIYIFFSFLFIIIANSLRAVLFYTKTINYELFMRIFVGKFLSTLGSLVTLLFGIISLFNPGYFFSNSNQKIPFIVLLVIISLLSLCYLALLFNPKLYKWYKLEKDEKEQLKRPKIIYLALYEWISYFVDIAAIILFVTSLILFSLI